MADSIFLKFGDEADLVSMDEAPYDSEALLQGLLADHPDLMGGSQIDPVTPRQWLLVSREMGVRAEEDGGLRWSLDHLFLDQDGIPTLVEVKRSSDTRIRREVVGQMLDYAANAVVYWPIEEIKARFERRCEVDGLPIESELAAVLGPETIPDTFWNRVRTNLQAGRVRLIFVADEIPSELRRIVEFLNGQMAPAEVLALEVRQYVNGETQILVPRVIGQTVEAQARKGSGDDPSPKWDEVTVFRAITEKRGSEIADIAQRVLAWTKENMGWVWWGHGRVNGSFGGGIEHAGTDYYLFAIYTYGRVEIYFQWLKSKPPFDNPTLRHELRNRLNAIPDIAIPEDAIERRPAIDLADLKTDEALQRFLSTMEWVITNIRGRSGQS